jgi:hypothetical protein
LFMYFTAAVPIIIGVKRDKEINQTVKD